MFSIIFLAVSALVLSLIFTPIARKLALHYGCGIDHPDQQRKVHKTPVPRLGGIPIVFAYAGAIGLLILISPSFPHVQHFAWQLVSASLLIFLTGLLDDLINLKPWQKLLGEVLAALLAYSGGIQIQTIGSYQIPELIALPLTVAWIVGCTNAFNLIDGLDGLAAGIGFLAAMASLFAGTLHGNIGLVVATAPLAGALLGFLYFNFNPASIFLGDSGSLWTGFLLACFGIIWSDKSITAISITAPLLALSLPLIDTALTIIRRLLRGQSIFHPDRGHIHHRLIERGLSTRRAVLLLYGVSALGASCSLLEGTASLGIRLPVIVLFGIVLWNGIRYLAYREFSIVALVLRTSHIRSRVLCHLRLCDYESLLGQANTIEDCWRALKTIRNDFKFSKVELSLCGHFYEDTLSSSPRAGWNLKIPLSDTEYVRFLCQYECASSAPVILPLADLLNRYLTLKMILFRAQMASMEIVKMERPIADRSSAGYAAKR
jgi:UDP-GlcNAc:undecaprenyl-phosphate/decaprenyl-phosphate GlcNAc-1-phosphate transferase